MAKLVARDVYGKEFPVTNSEDLAFRPSIYGIAVEEGKVLVVPQYDGYDFPGGGIEKGEDHLAALVREVKEETGLSCRPVGPVYVGTALYGNEAGKLYHAIQMYYFIEITGGEIGTGGWSEAEREYSQSARWVSLAELKAMRHANSVDHSVHIIPAVERLIERERG